MIEIRAAPGADGWVVPVYRYLDENLIDRGQLVEKVREGLRDSGVKKDFQRIGLLVRVDPRLSWGTVATALSELQCLDPGHGDKELNLLGLEILER